MELTCTSDICLRRKRTALQENSSGSRNNWNCRLGKSLVQKTKWKGLREVSSLSAKVSRNGAKKCEEELKHQESISVKAWVKAMDSRITSLGGEGVQRFLGNLFRAFDGLFESSSLPSKAAKKAVTVMQGVRQIKAAFDEVFTKDSTLGRANYHADRVLYNIAEIADVEIYCHK